MFMLKDLGALKYFIGLEIARFHQGITLSQCKYMDSLLDDSGFLACKLASSPMDPNLKLSSTDGDPLEDFSTYHSLIGKLSYLTLSKLDVAFIDNKLSQFIAQQ